MFVNLVFLHICVIMNRFDHGGSRVNLMSEFAVTFWLKYLTLMTGRPEATKNSAQLVLKYLLLNEKKLHQAWRNRIYRFSSGTTFSVHKKKLRKYLADHGKLLLRDVSNRLQ